MTFSQPFIEAALVILLSEIGDKTFFMAAIMAMRHPRLSIFAGAMAANGLMILISVALGRFAQLIPRVIVTFVSIGLFILFGVQTLREAWRMDPDEAREEFEEAEDEIKNREKSKHGEQSLSRTFHTFFGKIFDKVFLEIFVLTFLGEWGDRSQLATVLLSARQSATATLLGGAFGHIVSTGGAVACGGLIGQWISLRLVTAIGGLLFLLFGISELVEIVYEY